MKKMFLMNYKIPLLIIFAINIINFVYPLPIVFQLIASPIILTYVGCNLSTSVQTASYEQILDCEKRLKNRVEEGAFSKKCWEIAVYPLTATVALLFLYYFVTKIQKITTELVFNGLFMIVSTYYCIKVFFSYVSKTIRGFLDATSMSAQVAGVIKFILMNIVFPMVCFIPALLEVVTKHWFIDNLYGIILSIIAIKESSFSTFKIAMAALWIMFLYDLYWVYESDVMVTVAKSINLPLTLKFPYINETGQMKFSMLGLGDIVVPGLLLSICIKYDIDCCIFSNKRPKKIQQFTFPLFYSVLFAYGLSFIATYLALVYSSHPQPALVFIVPICSLAILIFSRFRQNLDIWKYDSKILTRRSNSQKRQEVSDVI